MKFLLRLVFSHLILFTLFVNVSKAQLIIDTTQSIQNKVVLHQPINFKNKLGIYNISISADKLKSIGISSFQDFNKVAALDPRKLNRISNEDVSKLRRASILNMVSGNDTINSALMKLPFNSVKELNRLSTKEIVNATSGKMTLNQAKAVKNNIIGLNNLIEAKKYNLAKNVAYGRYDKDLYPGITERQLLMLKQTFNDESMPCYKCQENNNMFSPAVYLLYLLDFVEKSFGEQYGTLPEINNRFYQRFEEIPISGDISRQGKYVQFANNVLATFYYHEIMGRIDFLNDNTIKQTSNVYKNFNNMSPYPDVLSDLFYRYVNEFGTDKSEIKFILRGSDNFQNIFTKKKGYFQKTLEFLDIPDENITYDTICAIKDSLYQFHYRKMYKIVEEEYISDLEDELRKEFQTYYRQVKRDSIDATTHKLIDQLPSKWLSDGINEERFDDTLTILKNQAKACVNLGILCPHNSFYDSLPINPLWELYRYYSKSLLNARDSIKHANKCISITKDTIKTRRLRLLLSDYNDNENPLNHLDSLKIQRDTAQYCFERIYSEEEFDYHLNALARIKFEKEIENPENKAAFLYEVNQRATEEWEIAISKAENGFHEKIRENLIKLILDKPQFNHMDVNQLADTLFLDLTVSEDYKTTPLSMSINRIHNFIQAARIGTIEANLDNFNNETWNWLKSYGTWHAAMMVSLYSENFLYPNLRMGVTPEFKVMLDTVESIISLDDLHRIYKNKISRIARIDYVGSFKTNEAIYLIGYYDKDFYFSKINKHNLWSPWKKIGTLNSKIEIDNNTNYINTSNIKLFMPNSTITNTTENLIMLVSYASYLYEESSTTRYHNYRFYCTVFQEENGIVKIVSGDEWKPINNLIVEDAYGSYRDFKKKYWISGADSYYKSFRLNNVLPDEQKYVSWMINYNTNDFTFTAEPVSVTNNTFYSDVNAVSFDWNGKYFLYDKSDGLYFGNNKIPNTGDISHAVNWISFGLDNNLNEDGVFRFFYLSTNGGKTKIIEKRGSEYIKSTESSVFFTDAAPIFQSILYFNGENYLFGGIADIHFSKTSLIGIGSLSTPLKIKYYWQKLSFDENLSINDRYRSTFLEDPSRIYLDEYYLYLPILIASKYNEQGKYKEAFNELSLVYDPISKSNKEIYPRFDEESDIGIMGYWSESPFNPYYFANLEKENFLVNIIFTHVENLLDWADHLFTLDNSESINRARELYEIASHILESHNWPEDTCSIDQTEFKEQFFEKEVEKEIEYVIGNQDLPSTFREAQLHRIVDQYRINSNNISISNLQTMEERLEVILADESPFLETLSRTQTFTEYAIDTNVVDIGAEIPELKPFCLPINPKLYYFRWRIQSNLEKIRNNCNYAGLKRELQPYATPVDPEKMVRLAAAGELDFENAIPTVPPPIYRYSFLVERAKYLAERALSFENSMLSSLTQLDQENYSLLRAKQDIKLEKANVNLQGLRINEAKHGLDQAEAQLDKSQLIYDHYEDLLSSGLNIFETLSLMFMHISIGLPSSVSAGVPPSGSVSYSPSGAMSTLSNEYATMASQMRREEEWRFQREMANADIDISEIGIDIAQDRIDIVNQEKAISELRLEFANDNIEFLTSGKFTNADLYKWMSKNLKKLYLDQLNMAISTAKAAQRALEFEKQTTLDFIGYEYWDSERKGLLGAEQLLNDIDEMENYRLSSSTRKREIEKTISLVSIAPAQFEEFRKTGVLQFETIKEWFDRDFPGHYLRMIKNVSVSVYGLIPLNEGIHATLSNPGISRIVTSPYSEEPNIIYRLPESVSISGTMNATGLFELRLDDPMLLPFEGNGVATTWTLEMPKGANRFDYSSVADILFTIRYTALEDRSYRQKVLDNMGQDEMGFVSTQSNRYFSIANEFPDQWYYMNNPFLDMEKDNYFDPFEGTKEELEENNKPLVPYSMVINLEEYDFVPNEENRKIKNITFAIQTDHEYFNEEDFNIPLKVKFIPDRGFESNIVEYEIEHIFDSRQDFNSKYPYGKWIIQLDVDNIVLPEKDLFSSYLNDEGKLNDLSWLKDIIMVIEYKADIHYNR